MAVLTAVTLALGVVAIYTATNPSLANSQTQNAPCRPDRTSLQGGLLHDQTQNANCRLALAHRLALNHSSSSWGWKVKHHWYILWPQNRKVVDKNQCSSSNHNIWLLIFRDLPNLPFHGFHKFQAMPMKSVENPCPVPASSPPQNSPPPNTSLSTEAACREWKGEGGGLPGCCPCR